MGDNDSDDASNADDQDSDDTEDDTTSDDDTTGDDEDDDTADDSDSETEDDDEDECAGLEADECSTLYDDDGNQVCGMNVQTAECYEVVESRGIYGRGNFDEGYTSAKQDAEATQSSLNLIVGVMGAVIGVLVLTIAGGAYFVHQNQKSEEQEEVEYGMEMGDLEDGIAGQDVDTADT